KKLFLQLFGIPDKTKWRTRHGPSCCLNKKFSSSFFGGRHFFDGEARSRKVERSGGRRLNGTAALSPGTNRNLVCDYDINSAQKRHFLRRQLGPQQSTPAAATRPTPGCFITRWGWTRPRRP